MAMGALDRDLRNMGTTVVMALWRKGPEMFIASVGDSRAYLIRDNNIEQLTVDHSLAQALVENKTISAAEARSTASATCCGSTWAARKSAKGPEVKVVPIQPGDRFLLCSDGLSGAVPDEQLLELHAVEHPTCRNAPTAWASSPSTTARATTSPASSSKSPRRSSRCGAVQAA